MGSFNISITKIQRALEVSVSVSEKGPSYLWNAKYSCFTNKNRYKPNYFPKPNSGQKLESSSLVFPQTSWLLHKTLLLLLYINKFFCLSIWIHIRHADIRHLLPRLSISSSRWHKVHSSLQTQPAIIGICQNNCSSWLVPQQLTWTLNSTLYSQWVKPSSDQQEGLQGCKVHFWIPGLLVPLREFLGGSLLPCDPRNHLKRCSLPLPASQGDTFKDISRAIACHFQPLKMVF